MIDNTENSYIQVTWEDTPENFTQERIKSVKQYFQKKYQSTNVNIITKVKINQDSDTQTVDVTTNIMDTNYQIELVKSMLVSKNLEDMTEDIIKFDEMVNNKVLSDSDEMSVFKKWYIKKIRFSNFLSYGDNQEVDFTKLNGIIAVESDPPNFGGKTVLSVDLLLFLFFNTTTKTTKAEEIFNRFTDKDTVSVSGEITIDGEDYLIERRIDRKKSKSGDWSVKTSLDFHKILPNGELQNFTGEQRRETENFIKNSIGEQDDFLMTILTTATNLEDLIESKPTARGQVISRFLGLDFLKRKEDVAKEFYSSFSKSMLGNVYSTESLKQEIDTLNDTNTEIEERNKVLIDLRLDVDSKLEKGREYRDNLLSKKHTDIDNSISLLNPEKLKSEISEHEFKIKQIDSELLTINVVEPTEFYNENQHDEVKEQINSLYKDLVRFDTQISDINTLKSSVEGGIKCEHCGIDLMDAAITNAKISELDGYMIEKEEKTKLMNDLSVKEQGFVKLKKDFDVYEKNKLIFDKLEITKESLELKISQLKNNLIEFNKIEEKIGYNKQIEQLIIKSTLRLDELEQEKLNYNKEISINETKIINNKEKVTKNLNLIIQIQEEFQKERIYKVYLELFGKNGISKLIMKSMIPLINSELQRLLEDSSYFRLEVRISDKNEVEFWMIDNGTGIEKLMVSGSGYERTIASLALRAVLSKICSLPKPNIIVMDEVFGKISNENLDMVGEFFQKIKGYFEKIFVITHNPLVLNWSDTILRVRKENNISKVIQ